MAAAVDPAQYPADSGPRDTISRDISRDVISCDAIFRDVISRDVIPDLLLRIHHRFPLPCIPLGAPWVRIGDFYLLLVYLNFACSVIFIEVDS